MDGDRERYILKLKCMKVLLEVGCMTFQEFVDDPDDADMTGLMHKADQVHESKTSLIWCWIALYMAEYSTTICKGSIVHSSFQKTKFEVQKVSSETLTKCDVFCLHLFLLSESLAA